MRLEQGMYLYDSEEDVDRIEQVLRDPSSTGLNRPDLVGMVKRLEIHATTFSHPGPDYTIIYALSGEDEVLAQRHAPGY